MSRISLKAVLAAASLAFPALSAQAAEFQIYTAPGFGGASIELRGETPDVSGLGNFHDQAASLIVNDRWEVCTEANYRGDCVVVGPGRYPTLNAPIRGRIGSIRPLAVKQAEERRNNYAAAPVPAPREDLRRDEIRREELRREELRRDEQRREEQRREELRREEQRRAELRREEIRREELRREEIRREESRRDRAARERARQMYGAVDLFPRSEYRGESVRVERDVPSLEDFTGRTASLVIHEGVWELCPEPGFRGRCRTLEPGRYPALRGGIASLRQVR